MDVTIKNPDSWKEPRRAKTLTQDGIGFLEWRAVVRAIANGSTVVVVVVVVLDAPSRRLGSGLDCMHQ